MFLVGASPVLLAVAARLGVHEPPRWKSHAAEARRGRPLRELFSPRYRRRTIVNSALLTVSIIGLWAAAVYEPTALIQLGRKAGMDKPEAVRLASYGTGLLSLGTILGCALAPIVAERWGRKRALSAYFAGMMVTIALAFGWAFYLHGGLPLFLAILFVMGVAGGNFALYTLWLPEQYETTVRASAFAFATSVGRFIGAGVNFLLAMLVHRLGTLGTPVACTALAFAAGLLVIPFAVETRGDRLPE
jgi:MFS family permease